MPDPVYRIYYGKYPDNMPNEIPNEHIRELDTLSFKIEPGKPAEPKLNSISFTLENLNADGTERYNTAWFEEQSRSLAEGAVSANQLFFKIVIPDHGNKTFIGVLDKKKPGPWKETVKLTIKDPRSLIKKSSLFLLKPFTFDQVKLESKDTSPAPSKGLYSGEDLEGTSLTDERLTFEYTSEWYLDYDDLKLNHPYWDHRGLQPVIDATDSGDAGTTIWTEDRCAFVKIGDNIILTKINEYITVAERPTGGGSYYYLIMGIQVFHAKNGNTTVDGKTILERGRFFEDDKGTDLSTGNQYTITIYDYNLGNDDDILLDQPTGFDTGDSFHYLNGYPITVDVDDTYDITTTEGYFNTLSELISIFEDKLYAEYYENTPVNLFNTNKSPDKYKYAFWPDLLLYGWLDASPEDVLVSLAMQLNCYLYYNEDGEVVFHKRLYHEDYLPGTLPPNAFEIKTEDIKPLDYDDTYGFDCFEISLKDRLPINNIEPTGSESKFIDKDGVRSAASLRTSDLKIGNYRTDDLGVPTLNTSIDQVVLRYSPAGPDWVGIPGVSDSIDDFIPTPEIQAQNFAKSFTYPVEIRDIEVDLAKYSQASIGGYFYVTEDGVNKVHLIKQVHYKPDEMRIGIQGQYVGDYTP